MWKNVHLIDPNRKIYGAYDTKLIFIILFLKISLKQNFDELMLNF